ncbi:hypothetical protein PRZ48_005256 [Zasmidium cellare]|uniref:FAD-binding domain-containing protein n=1 Tax=Zasmidium cellare TaxID=395010 RepID=A0ABR0ESV9_ZASCE|nr:hypothetical protein PRZ48_005256 [Zasmidium cellare]
MVEKRNETLELQPKGRRTVQRLRKHPNDCYIGSITNLLRHRASAETSKPGSHEQASCGTIADIGNNHVVRATRLHPYRTELGNTCCHDAALKEASDIQHKPSWMSVACGIAVPTLRKSMSRRRKDGDDVENRTAEDTRHYGNRALLAYDFSSREQEMSGSKPFDVAIVGGGIAGLTLAIGLLKHKIPVTIYESAHHFGEIGAGVYFSPNAARAMNGIDPSITAGFERVATANKDPALENVWFEFRHGEDSVNGKSGDLFCRMGWEGSQSHGGVHRAKFLDELIKLIPDGVAHFGKRVAAIDQVGDKVKLTFKDGPGATHDCVVGCDGIHSETRKFILGPDDPALNAVFSGKYCHRGLVPMEEAVAALGEDSATNSQNYVGHHGHLLTFPVEKGKVFNAVAFSSCETWDYEKWVVQSDVKNINEDFKNFGAPVQKVINMMRDTDIWALFQYLPARTFYSGHVVMIGDAAHATTPHQGSGAAMAIEDAYVLSSLLANVNHASKLEAAFNAFDAVRRQRGWDLVTTSAEAGTIWELEHPVIGDDFDKFRENATSRMDWIWGEDLEIEVKQGLQLLASM